MSQKLSSTKLLKICALFPRRPKPADDGRIFMMVNPEVMSYASKLVSVGIPVFAGIPIVSSFFQLSEKFSCYWYSLNISHNPFDYKVVECTDEVFKDPAITGPLHVNEILDDIDHAQSETWQHSLDKLNAIRVDRDSYDYFNRFGPRYKPIYFLCS